MIKTYKPNDSVLGFQTIPKRRISSVLVGRDGELNKLKHHVSKVIKGEGSIINLMGESGTGEHLDKIKDIEGEALDKLEQFVALSEIDL